MMPRTGSRWTSSYVTVRRSPRNYAGATSQTEVSVSLSFRSAWAAQLRPEHAQPVLAQHLSGVGFAPTPSYEGLGHEREAGRAIESGDGLLVVEALEGLPVRRGWQLFEDLLHEVRAEAHVLDARDR